MEVDLRRGQLEVLDGTGPTHGLRISGSEPAALVLMPIGGTQDAPVPVDAQGDPGGDWRAAMRILTSFELDEAAPETWTIHVDARALPWDLDRVRHALASFVITPDNRNRLLRGGLTPVPLGGEAGSAGAQSDAGRARVERWRKGEPDPDDRSAVAQRMLQVPDRRWTLDLP